MPSLSKYFLIVNQEGTETDKWVAPILSKRKIKSSEESFQKKSQSHSRTGAPRVWDCRKLSVPLVEGSQNFRSATRTTRSVRSFAARYESSSGNRCRRVLPRGWF